LRLSGCYNCMYYCYRGAHYGLCIKHFEWINEKEGSCDHYRYGECIGDLDGAIIEIIQWAKENGIEKVFNIIKSHLKPVEGRRFSIH